MLNSLNPRAALTATTALVAVGLITVVPNWQQSPGLSSPESVVTETVTLEEAADETRLRQDKRSEGTALAGGEANQSLMADAPLEMAESETMPEPAPAPMAAAKPSADAEGYAVGALTRSVADADDAFVAQEATTEAYPDATPNPLKITVEEPVSTFSIDVDTASYAVVRSSLSQWPAAPRRHSADRGDGELFPL